MLLKLKLKFNKQWCLVPFCLKKKVSYKLPKNEFVSLYGFIGVVLSVLAYERERDDKAILQNSAEFFELLFIFLVAASLILKERVIVVISVPSVDIPASFDSLVSVHSSDIPAYYKSCSILKLLKLL